MTDGSTCQRQDAQINGLARPDKSVARTLPDICFELQAKIDAFLCEDTDDDVLRKVQAQVKVSVDVIREALRRYG